MPARWRPEYRYRQIHPAQRHCPDRSERRYHRPNPHPDHSGPRSVARGLYLPLSGARQGQCHSLRGCVTECSHRPRHGCNRPVELPRSSRNSRRYRHPRTDRRSGCCHCRAGRRCCYRPDHRIRRCRSACRNHPDWCRHPSCRCPRRRKFRHRLYRLKSDRRRRWPPAHHRRPCHPACRRQSPRSRRNHCRRFRCSQNRNCRKLHPMRRSRPYRPPDRLPR